jgi:translation initiation factor IF-2
MGAAFGPEQHEGKVLEIVLKSDSFGTQEAVLSSLKKLEQEGSRIEVIHAAIGPVSQSDLFLAMPGSKLIIAFNVDVLPRMEWLSKEKGVEVRIYQTIYALTDDLRKIASSLVPAEPEERITGAAKVIALFKSSRKGIILGCEVTDGELVLGRDFRIISGPGVVHTGKIESLHIEKDEVTRAKVGQQVGVKIADFNRGRLGDLLECFETVRMKGRAPWKPKGGVVRQE